MSLFEEIADPLTCEHPKHELSRIIQHNGASLFFMRCVDCNANVNGHGKWLAHDLAYDHLEDIPVVRDDRELVPPCERCGALGAERHHWHPSAIDGKEEADNWPTGWLCTKCHNLWHLRIIRAAIDGKLGKA